MSTIFFMNKVHPWLDGQTPLECAEQSEEGLKFVLDMIGAIEAGVHI
ncbi:MbcA/ParS/Xre antitoxin family protein [Qipengyuania flava]|nr:MbcA/ParS/Xre antitoxin family protein [Qipengyuania flava]